MAVTAPKTNAAPGPGQAPSGFAPWRPWRTFKAPLVWILHCAYAWIVLALALRALAALTRVFLPLAVPALYLWAIVGSGLLRSAAFCVFTFVYWPILTRPRLDGKPGCGKDRQKALRFGPASRSDKLE